METILLWIAKKAISYGLNYLAKKLGFEKAQSHVIDALENAKPLAKDPNPPLSTENNPNLRNHYE